MSKTMLDNTPLTGVKSSSWAPEGKPCDHLDTWSHSVAYGPCPNKEDIAPPKEEAEENEA